MNAVSSCRRTMKTSGPSAQSRSTTTVAAGRGLAGKALGATTSQYSEPSQVERAAFAPTALRRASPELALLQGRAEAGGFTAFSICEAQGFSPAFSQH